MNRFQRILERQKKYLPNLSCWYNDFIYPLLYVFSSIKSNKPVNIFTENHIKNEKYVQLNKNQVGDDLVYQLVE